jgi:hypothetical protein
MLAEANTMITQNPTTITPAPLNGTSLLSSHPKTFDGNCNEAKEFMHSYKRWWRLNDEKHTFSIPYKHVALCISYISGKKVEDWADAQQDAMDERVNLSYSHTDESLWRKFEKAFTDTFTDIAKGVKADKELETLHMKDGNINIYIATFKKLLKLARYNEAKYSTLKMFKRGLPNGLNIGIITNNNPVPATLEDWIKAAHQQ